MAGSYIAKAAPMSTSRGFRPIARLDEVQWTELVGGDLTSKALAAAYQVIPCCND